jgi:hypothetical protein
VRPLRHEFGGDQVVVPRADLIAHLHHLLTKEDG